MVALIMLGFLSGCRTGRPGINDLYRASELRLSPGTAREKVLSGRLLQNYLRGFSETPQGGMVDVRNSQRGTITLNGRAYPVHYCELETDSSPAMITVKVGDEVLSITQGKYDE